MIDERNRQLAEVTRVDDVIVSDKIISLMLTQISENRELARSSPSCSPPRAARSTCGPPATTWPPGARSSYATVVEAALRRGECAIGYREAAQADDPGRDFGVRINPPKAERIRSARRPGDRPGRGLTAPRGLAHRI